jgi:SpoIID/LytB domain protein
MVIVGSDQTVTAHDSQTIREALNLDSSLVVIEKHLMGSWTIHGGGYGHGVGLCQCGAIGLVEKAKANYRHVLNFYFEALRLGKRDLVRSSRGA